MSYTLEDYFNAFLEVKRFKQFSTGVQAVYFSILGEFYKQHFPTNIALSTRDLQALAGLKSASSTHEAKNVLKNNGLVDFQNRFGTTVYSLGLGRIPNTFRTTTEHLANTSRTLTEQSSTPYHSISCTQNQSQSSTTQEIEKQSISLQEKEKTNTQSSSSCSSSCGDVKNFEEVTEPEEMDVVTLWEFMTGEELKSSFLREELKELEIAHGRKVINDALKEFVNSKGQTFKYFKKVLDSCLAPKGGEKVGRKPDASEKKPARPDTSEYPW